MDKYFNVLLNKGYSIPVTIKVYGEIPANGELIRIAVIYNEFNPEEAQFVETITEITAEEYAALKGEKYLPKVELVPEQDYVSKGLLLEFQEVVKELFSNFDGGFGLMRDDNHQKHQPVNAGWGTRDEITFGFTTMKPIPHDIAMLTWPPNGFKGVEDYFEPRQAKSYRINWIEMITIVCEVYNITPKICGTTVKEVIAAHAAAKKLN